MMRKAKAQRQQEQVAAQALLEFTQDLTFDQLTDAILQLLKGRPDFDEIAADQMTSRITGIAWKRRRGML